MKYCLTTVIVLLITALCAAQDDAQITLKPSEPGVYTINDRNDQQVMFWISLGEVDNATALNTSRNIKDLVAKDNGTVKPFERTTDNGTERVLLISASAAMAETVQSTLAELQDDATIHFTPPTDFRQYTPKHRSAQYIADVLDTKALSSVGKTFVDAAGNRLYYEDHPGCLDGYVLGWIQALDVPQKTTTLEIEVLETAVGDRLSLGVYWDAWKQTLPTDVSLVVNGTYNQITDRVEVGDWSALMNLNPQALTNFINYLQTENVAMVSAKTTLNVISGQTTTYEAGVSHPFTITTDGTGAALEHGTEFEGLALSITPTIASESTQLQLIASSSSVVGMAVNGRPVISSNDIETLLVVEQKEQSFIITGLERNSEVQVKTGIPLLKDIPVVDWLASWNRTQKQQRNVMVRITVK